MTPLLAELPDSGWLIIICVVVGIIGLVGIAVIVGVLRGFRENLADEIKREIDTKQAAAPVQVQSPLIVKAHEHLVTREEHQKLEARMAEELGRERGARKKIHEEIGTLQGDVKVLQSQNDNQTRQLSNLDGKIDQVLMRLPRSQNVVR